MSDGTTYGVLIFEYPFYIVKKVINQFLNNFKIILIYCEI